MKQNSVRNKAMLALSKSGLSYAKIAKLFPPISRQRVGQVVQQEKKKLSTPK